MPKNSLKIWGKEITLKKIAVLIAGISLISLGITFFIKAGVGAEPWSLFYAGVGKILGLKVGYVTQLTGLAIVLFVLIADRVKPHLATILSFVLSGFLVNWFMNFNLRSDNIITGSIFFAAAVIFMCAGIGMYVAADLGQGPIELLQFYISRKTGKKIAAVRVVMDCTVSVIGFLCSGPLGLGTIIAALTIGPLITRFISLSRQFIFHEKSAPSPTGEEFKT